MISACCALKLTPAYVTNRVARPGASTAAARLPRAPTMLAAEAMAVPLRSVRLCMAAFLPVASQSRKCLVPQRRYAAWQVRCVGRFAYDGQRFLVWRRLIRRRGRL